MRGKAFTCSDCKKTKPVIEKIQPVPVGRRKICQHCWASATWGKKWADHCEESEQ